MGGWGGWHLTGDSGKREDGGERKIRFACVKRDGVFPLLFVVTAAERGNKVECGITAKLRTIASSK